MRRAIHDEMEACEFAGVASMRCGITADTVLAAISMTVVAGRSRVHPARNIRGTKRRHIATIW